MMFGEMSSRYLLALLAVFPAVGLDLTHATVVAPATLSAREKRAAAMLAQEVARRSQVRWPVAAAPASGPSIVIERGSGPAEGFRIRMEGGGVRISGNDERGVLFGVGRLLRELRMSAARSRLPDDFEHRHRAEVRAARPSARLPAEDQLLRRAGRVPMWEQYIRDLAVFGTNAIELIPPRSDDAADSPHFPLPPMEMMIDMSRLPDEYGLDVWIWYPAMDKDYSDPETVEFALKEWGEVFRQLPRIDAIFVPGGDPGHTDRST